MARIVPRRAFPRVDAPSNGEQASELDRATLLGFV
jgi:hypothetical protein